MLSIRRIAVAHEAGKWTVKERWTSVRLKPYFNDFVIHDGHAFGFNGRLPAIPRRRVRSAGESI
jgi:hypothetical protein